MQFAVEAISDAMRREMQPFTVSVSLVEPGYVETPIKDKNFGAHGPERLATEEERRTYVAFFSAYEAKRKKNFYKAATVEVTTEAITHALTSPTPDTRYVVGNVLGIHAIFTVAMTWILPDRVLDFIVLNEADALLYLGGFFGAFVVACLILFRKN